jgi:hypothetical protein
LCEGGAGREKGDRGHIGKGLHDIFSACDETEYGASLTPPESLQREAKLGVPSVCPGLPVPAEGL